jgi:V/A-type H+-transporting ATPase subunit I
LPSYNEIDPTPFVAITTLVMFGVMFGDIGQGLFILLLGLFLKFKFKAGFSGIAIWGGISSIMFGFLYGSIFANEEIIKPIWAHPMHSINTILIISVSYGIVLTLISMCLNLVNCFKHGNRGGLIFDKNGIAGILFYLIIITSIVAYIIKGKMIIPVPIIIILMLISVLAMFLKEPLENLIEKKNHFLPEDKGGFFVESIFELLETIMGFISNTISFVRIGAFALNHAGLSLAIWTLYNMANGSAGILVIVFGNLLIIGMEGLIVGIQCLRLQYYEIFSHFFKGEGVEFENINIDRIKV